MAIRDVTPTLRVDTDLAGVDPAEEAEQRVRAGMTAVVGSDDDAKAVLVGLGLDEDLADVRIRNSYGPMS